MRAERRHVDVHQLLQQQLTVSAIARRLRLDRKTVRRLGASVTMLASELLLNGVDRIRTIRRGLEVWLEEREYESVMQLQDRHRTDPFSRGLTGQAAEPMRGLRCLSGDPVFISVVEAQPLSARSDSSIRLAHLARLHLHPLQPRFGTRPVAEKDRV